MLHQPTPAVAEALPKLDRLNKEAESIVAQTNGRAVVSSMRELECEVGAVMQMATVLHDLIEFEFQAALGFRNTDPDADAIVCAESRANITFMAYELDRRARQLHKAYQAAYWGKKQS
ncbi:hypothetical protein PZN02_000447 [Sinorhizobium garamanticum]|uniref:Uncharacterized protein n=1 Tax=Sinorhizobium garamanticum TaxID=680247 RepID=A0ABY8DG89_9HYPH|nr:hypothetical protein [Sinorhizobium garamanticum]WEX88001.1 hypothetical protein PZN02_000447 [Sinorhizobium garamanticum]